MLLDPFLSFFVVSWDVFVLHDTVLVCVVYEGVAC